MKTCSACKRELPRSEFFRDKRTPDGLYYRCKDCHRASGKKSYRRHREKKLAWQREYQRKHPERRKAARAKWEAKNPDSLPKRAKRYRDCHKAEIAEKWAEYYIANREQVLERRRGRRDWRKHYDPIKWAEYRRQYRARLLEAFVAPVNEAEIIIRDLGICGICGDPADGVIELDHVIPLSRDGTHEPNNVQLAHRLCNRKKWARTDLTP